MIVLSVWPQPHKDNHACVSLRRKQGSWPALVVGSRRQHLALPGNESEFFVIFSLLDPAIVRLVIIIVGTGSEVKSRQMGHSGDRFGLSDFRLFRPVSRCKTV
jgi:hypothetical protein